MGGRRPGRYGLVFVPGPGVSNHEPILRTDDVGGLEGASQAPPGSLFAELATLTQHPGRWAIVVTYRGRKSASALATDLRAGRRPVPGGGTFTFAAPVGAPSGESHLYALFSGCPAAAVGAHPEGGTAGRRLPFVPAGPVARHLRLLVDRGVGLRTVSDRSGVSLSTLSRLVYGGGGKLTSKSRVHKRTAEAVLAITAERGTQPGRHSGRC
jgi:hypothetical protein